jgi:hypothetical protein
VQRAIHLPAIPPPLLKVLRKHPALTVEEKTTCLEHHRRERQITGKEIVFCIILKKR